MNYQVFLLRSMCRKGATMPTIVMGILTICGVFLLLSMPVILLQYIRNLFIAYCLNIAYIWFFTYLLINYSIHARQEGAHIILTWWVRNGLISSFVISAITIPIHLLVQSLSTIFTAGKKIGNIINITVCIIFVLYIVCILFYIIFHEYYIWDNIWPVRNKIT